MIAFHSPTLKDSKLFSQLKNFNFFTSVIFHSVWREYYKYAKDRNRVIGKPILRIGDKQINVVGIRNNPEVSFNDKDTFYNDLLVIEFTEKQAHIFFVFKVTMDPKARKYKIAHLLEGVYASYTALRPHRWVPGRTAIVQDRDNVFVARTNSKGEIVDEFKEHKGFFGINIHDSGGFLNSSEGCTVLELDSETNDYHWKKHFKPLILEAENKDSIDYMVMNKEVAIELARSAAYNTTPSRMFLDKVSFRAPFLITNLKSGEKIDV